MIKPEQPIGIFDSGVGGLTVVRAMMKLLPHENLIYFGDTARVPYGTKSPQVVREYSKDDADFLIKKNVKIIIIACNTVSAVAIDVVQKTARVPVFGVIAPGAKSAIEKTKNKKIGIIGTNGTVNSKAYENAIKLIDKNIQSYGQACPLFVPLVEEDLIEHKATELLAKEYLFNLTVKKIDTLILGCTHYPLLKNVIDKITFNQLNIIDSGEATAFEVKDFLEKENLLNKSKMKSRLEFYVSDAPEKFTSIGEKFLGTSLGIVKKVNIT